MRAGLGVSGSGVEREQKYVHLSVSNMYNTQGCHSSVSVEHIDEARQKQFLLREVIVTTLIVSFYSLPV